jgi:hypothetical protein
MAKAHLEITGALIRVGPDDFQWGDTDFYFSVPLIGDEQVATLKGLVYPGFGIEHKIAIHDVLVANRFTHYTRWRHRPGWERKFVRIKL